MIRPSWADLGRIDTFSRIDAPAQHLDARAKAIVVGAFILTVVSFPRQEVAGLLPLSLFPLALILLGRLSPGFILQKVAVASLLAFSIGIIQPVFDRHPLPLFGGEIAAGWLTFASIMTRCVLIISASLGLLACTGLYPLCAGLEKLGLPRLLVIQLLMLHRYLFVIAEEGGRMWCGWRSRAAGKGGMPMRIYGWLLGHLLLRTLDRAERVHRAMAARGFDGRVHLLVTPRWHWQDGAFLFGWVFFFGLIRWQWR